MTKAWTIGLAAVVLVATLPIVGARSRSPEPVLTAEATPAPRYSYSSAPRIIHVPQPDEDEADLASVPPRVRAINPPDNDDEDEAAPPRRQVMPRPPSPQKKGEAPPAPRRKPYTTTSAPPAPPSVERRAILNAPAAVNDGPTPVRPTPKFDNAGGTMKFASPPPPGLPPADMTPADVPGASPPETAPTGD